PGRSPLPCRVGAAEWRRRTRRRGWAPERGSRRPPLAAVRPGRNRCGRRRSLRRVFPVEATPNQRGDTRGQDGGEGADPCEETGPDEALDDIVVHERRYPIRLP